jgi:histidinol phosphatase-like enzyme (inositol monophosphatase family)
VKTDLADALRLAERAARTGGQIALHHFRKGVSFRRKSDGSPVTDADVAAEEAVRKLLEQGMPGIPILGEEMGGDSPDKPADRERWIVDPIDGTRNFVRGIPLFATLIALEVDGSCTVGAAYSPALDEIITAARGMGCQWNGRPARVSSTDDLSDALVVYGGLEDLLAEPNRGPFLELAARTERQRGLGDYYGHLLVATGRAEIMVETSINAWDVACWKVMMEEAGGRFTDLAGIESIYSGSALATNGLLHDKALEIMKRTP